MEYRRRDEENRDAYVTSSYHIGKTHENKRVGAVHDICGRPWEESTTS